MVLAGWRSVGSGRIDATRRVGTDMAGTTSVRCYIEEHEVSPGRLGARLREKGTGRKVDLGFAGADEKKAFLRFLGTAHSSRATMPEVFEKDGPADAVEVSGTIDFDAPDELRFVHGEQTQYVFV